MNKKSTGILLFSLFLISLLFRLLLISKGPYHSDCLYFAIQAEKILETGRMHYLHASGLPLLAITGAGFIGLLKLFGTTDPVFAVNLLNVILGALSVPVFYILAARLFSQRAAVFAAILLAFNPIFLTVSTFGNAHILALLFYIFSLIFLLKYFENHAISNFLISAACFGLMGASRLQDMILMAIPISFLILFTFKPHTSLARTTIKLLAYLLIAGLIISVFYIPSLLQAQTDPILEQYQYHFQVTMKFIQSFKDSALLTKNLYLSYFRINFAELGLLSVIAGCFLMLKRKEKIFPFLLAWFLVPFLFFCTRLNSVPRFFLIAFLPLIFFQAYFIDFLWAKNWARKAMAMALLSISILLPSLYILPTLAFRNQTELLPDYYRWIAKVTPSNATLIEADNGIFAEYYGHRKILWPPFEIYNVDQNKFSEFIDTIDHNLESGIPTYITATGLQGHSKEFHFEELLRNRYTLIPWGVNLLEDWHLGEWKVRVGENPLYLIQKKSPTIE